MFAHIRSTAILVLAVLVVFATAIPGGTPPKTTSTVTVTNTATQTVTVTATPGAPGGSVCSTGSAQCCNSVHKASDPGIGLLAGLLGIVFGRLDILVGLACSPLGAIGASGNSCNTQTVCCEHNEFKSLIAIGCTPINIIL